MKLDAITLKTLTLPPGKSDHKFFDERLPGHGVRLRHPTDQSKWRWITQYDDVGGRTQIVTHGPVSLIDPGPAFKRSKDLLASVRLGGDPANEKREARALTAETFGTLLTVRYLPYKQAQLRPESYKEVERHLVKYAKPLHPRPVASIDRRAIAALTANIVEHNGPNAATYMLGSLSGYFTWLLREGIIDGANPAAYVNKPVIARPRERVLTADELRTIRGALGDDDFSIIARLLMYLPARKTEIGGLLWDEIDWDAAEIKLPPSRTKNVRAHIIPLTAVPLEILRRRWDARDNDRATVFGVGPTGFTGWDRGKKRLERATGPMAHWTLHDFRRTFSTVAHDKLGVEPHLVEVCLGHAQKGVAAVYNRASYIEAKRRALERWAEWVDAAVSGKPIAAQVVRMKRK
jgi:integrase